MGRVHDHILRNLEWFIALYVSTRMESSASGTICPRSGSGILRTSSAVTLTSASDPQQTFHKDSCSDFTRAP